MLAKYMIKDFFRDIKWRYQRAKRGYADIDVWDIDYWFMNIIPKMLTQLRDTTHGAPVLTAEGATNENYFEIWKGILNKMIYLANEMNEDTCHWKNEFEEAYFESLHNWDIFDESKRPTLSTDDAIGKKYYEEEKRIMKYREGCKNKFFKMFSKYFYDLWD